MSVRKKILHLPTTVGGNPQGISRAMNKIGLISQSWTTVQNYLNYPTDLVISNSSNLIVKEIQKILALRYVFMFDVIMFNFGQMLFKPHLVFDYKKYPKKMRYFLYCYAYYNRIMASIEITLLKLLGRKLFVQFQGDDLRQGDYCIENYSTSIAHQLEDYYHPNTDKMKRRLYDFFSKNCEKIYCLNPDLLNVADSKAVFLPYSHIDLVEWSAKEKNHNKLIRIGHAPSHRGAKGTDYILKVLNELLDEGFRFEIDLIEGVSHAEAKIRYEQLDLMIDQLYAGWYGGLAVEMMALNVPVMAYIRKNDLRHIPEAMKQELPIINVNEKTLKERLRKFLTSGLNERNILGLKSRRFVENYHDPEKIALRLKSDFKI